MLLVHYLAEMHYHYVIGLDEKDSDQESGIISSMCKGSQILQPKFRMTRILSKFKIGGCQCPKLHIIVQPYWYAEMLAG